MKILLRTYWRSYPRLQASPAGEQLDQQDHDRDDEDQMDQATRDVKAKP